MWKHRKKILFIFGLIISIFLAGINARVKDREEKSNVIQACAMRGFKLYEDLKVYLCKDIDGFLSIPQLPYGPPAPKPVKEKK